MGLQPAYEERAFQIVEVRAHRGVRETEALAEP